MPGFRPSALRAVENKGLTPVFSLRLPVSPARLNHIVRGLFNPILAAPDNGDGFPEYVRRARAAGIDVNDWIEKELGWLPARPILEHLVFPLLRPDSSVCEVGVGTGRWSRHIVERIPDGRMLLVDRSPWVVQFLRTYFAGRRGVRAVIGDGVTIPAPEEEWADLFFSQGMFITLKLGHIYRYLSEFARALKPRGHVVFDFIDPSHADGWAFLQRESLRSHDVFSFHTAATIVECCNAVGLTLVHSQNVGKSTYFIAIKN